MADELTTTAFKIPNRDALAKNSGKVFKLMIIGAIGLAAYVYLLPFLIGIVWGTAELIGGIIVSAFLLYLLSQPKLWRAMNYFSQFIAEKLLSIAIEMNPWQIMYNQLDAAQEDRDAMHKQAILLQGQQSKIKDEMAGYNRDMKDAYVQVDIAKKALARTTDPAEQAKINRQLVIQDNRYTSAKEYIDGVKPTLDGIDKTVDFLGRAYDQSGDVIQIYRDKIKVMKARYDAITTGSLAMAKAQAAFEGRPQLNADSLKAMDYLRTDMGNKLGAMKESLKIASTIMDGKDLADAAKIQAASESMDQFKLNDKFRYSDTVHSDDPTFSIQGDMNQGNKFLKLLK